MTGVPRKLISSFWKKVKLFRLR